MSKHRMLILLLLVLILGLGGCTRAKPSPAASSQLQPTLTEETGDSDTSAGHLEFRFKQPIGDSTHTVAGDEFKAVFESCCDYIRVAPVSLEHQETHKVPETYVLDMSGLNIDLAPHRAALESFIRDSYGINDLGERSIEDTVILKERPHSIVTYTLRWDETWERNALDILRDGQVVASVPLEVFTLAKLVVVSSSQEPCKLEEETTPQSVSVPVVISADRTAQAIGTTISATPTFTAPPTALPGSDEAIALILDYLESIDRGDLRRAYNLLHETYRVQHPFESYVRGYEPVVGIEIRGIEATCLGEDEEKVEAGMTIAMTKQGETIYSDWWAIYEVISTPDKNPYQRSIRSVNMQRLPTE